MTGGAAMAAGTPGALLDAVHLAQVTSERLGLTVAALIALAVLAVLGGVLVMVLRRQAQDRALDRQAPGEAGTGGPQGALWAAGARGEVRPGGDGAIRDERGHPAADGGVEPDPGAGPGRARTGASPRRAPADEPSRPLDEALVVRPPLPGEAWVAEIIWAAHATRFRVVARRSDDADAEPVAIAQTEALPWPPRDDASVQALTDASTTLEKVLLDSGWSGLPTGETWYSKRFAWAPQAAEPEPQVPRGTGRFERRRSRVPDPVTPVAQDAAG